MLYLSKKLFQFGKAETPLCSFCKNYEKRPMHFFSNCEHMTNEWTKVRELFKNYINLTHLTPDSHIRLCGCRG